MSEEHNRNPTGISILIGISTCVFLKHFILTVQVDNPVLKEALQKYHREGRTNNAEIWERLLTEYNITLGYDRSTAQQPEIQLRSFV